MSEAWACVARGLAQAGVPIVIGLPADEPGLLDAARREPELTAVSVRDQRGAGPLACGYSIVSGRPAALALSSGPDFSSAMPGLVEAASLRVPVVVVTTRIPAAGIGRGGFQELDQAGILESLVRWHHLVNAADQLVWASRQAVRQAVTHGGLALLEISAEALAEGGRPGIDAIGGRVERPLAIPPGRDLDRATELLEAARRPLILAGGGCRAGGAGKRVEELADRLGAAVLTTASGRGVVDERHCLACGLSGLYATPPVQEVASDADLVLVLGSRIEETMRLGWSELSDAAVIHVDLEASVFGMWTEPALALLGDARLVAEELLRRLPSFPEPDLPRPHWRARIRAARDTAIARHLPPPSFGQSPVRASMGAVSELFAEGVIVQENGLNDIWGYHWPVLQAGGGMSVVVPGEQTMLGFGLPAAIGAALAVPDRPVLAICGDGALGMSLPALPAAVDLACGLVLLVFDNHGFGWPRLLRDEDGDADLTRFGAVWDWGGLIDGLNGWWARPHDDASLWSSLREARRIAAERRLAMVVVDVPDGDVPIGVERIFGEEHA